MAMPSRWAVVKRLKEDRFYRNTFRRLFDIDLAQVLDAKDADKLRVAAQVFEVYELMAWAIGEFEKSYVFNKFNSKYDYFLAGMTELTSVESKGLALFNGKGNCAACHISQMEHLNNNGRVQCQRCHEGSEGGRNSKQDIVIPPLLTDFTYHNIGLPRNEDIPGNPEPDLGLGGRVDIKALDMKGEQLGKHKVMSLRNVALTPPYGHNGVLKTLKQVVHFYNTRDTLGRIPSNKNPGFGVTGWPEPEIAKNVNLFQTGSLGLTDQEEDAIVAFLETLTDDYPVWGNDPRVPSGTEPPFGTNFLSSLERR